MAERVTHCGLGQNADKLKDAPHDAGAATHRLSRARAGGRCKCDSSSGRWRTRKLGTATLPLAGDPCRASPGMASLLCLCMYYPLLKRFCSQPFLQDNGPMSVRTGACRPRLNGSRFVLAACFCSFPSLPRVQIPMVWTRCWRVHRPQHRRASLLDLDVSIEAGRST
jgi:hypothetical protein